jgi:hypothetical protein
MPYLLRDDLRRGFNPHVATEDTLDNERGSAQRFGGDEVYLPFLESKLQREGLFDVVRSKRLSRRVEARGEEAEPLRIRNEDVDVLAEAMVVTEHQHGSSAERGRGDPADATESMR